jgi:hypothetical protein
MFKLKSIPPSHAPFVGETLQMWTRLPKHTTARNKLGHNMAENVRNIGKQKVSGKRSKSAHMFCHFTHRPISIGRQDICRISRITEVASTTNLPVHFFALFAFVRMRTAFPPCHRFELRPHKMFHAAVAKKLPAHPRNRSIPRRGTHQTVVPNVR